MSKAITDVGIYVHSQISSLLFSSNDAYIRSTLAKLRKGAGKEVGEVPEIWDITLLNISDKWMSKDGNPTKEEIVIHTAITYFALHQQGKDIKTQAMHIKGVSLGDAINKLYLKYDKQDTINKLYLKDNKQDTIKKRFDVIVTSSSIKELTYHLRGIIQLLKKEGIGLDYGKLADDLLFYQIPKSTNKVRLKWGQDFYKINKKEEIKEQ